MNGLKYDREEQEKRYKARLKEIEFQRSNEFDMELRNLQKAVKEKEKLLELQRINSDERLQLAIDTKNEELKKIQEQFSDSYQQQQHEMQKHYMKSKELSVEIT